MKDRKKERKKERGGRTGMGDCSCSNTSIAYIYSEGMAFATQDGNEGDIRMCAR